MTIGGAHSQRVQRGVRAIAHRIPQRDQALAQARGDKRRIATGGFQQFLAALIDQRGLGPFGRRDRVPVCGVQFGGRDGFGIGAPLFDRTGQPDQTGQCGGQGVVDHAPRDDPCQQGFAVKLGQKRQQRHLKRTNSAGCATDQPRAKGQEERGQQELIADIRRHQTIKTKGGGQRVETGKCDNHRHRAQRRQAQGATPKRQARWPDRQGHRTDTQCHRSDARVLIDRFARGQDQQGQARHHGPSRQKRRGYKDRQLCRPRRAQARQKAPAHQGAGHDPESQRLGQGDGRRARDTGRAGADARADNPM